MIIMRYVLHHLMVRSKLIVNLKHDTLDTLIAIGDAKYHNHVELFSLSSSKWENKKDYPYSKDIYSYSILAVENKFIIFGGWSHIRKVLANQDIKKYENI